MINSYLFVPGNQPGKITKALTGTAHAVILDLEDSVGVQNKTEARGVLRNTLKELPRIDKDIYIRMNDFQSSFWEEDLRLIQEFDFLGLVIPLVEDGSAIKKLNDYSLSTRNIIPIIETAKGIRNINSVLSTDVNIERIAFGVLDFCLDINIPFQSNNPLVSHSRMELVLASHANGVDTPIDSVYASFKDTEGFMQELNNAKQLGITSKLCIHPAQVDLVNDFYRVDEQEYKWAKQVKILFEKEEDKGVAAVSVNDEMIDYPMYKRALLILEKHNKEKK